MNDDFSQTADAVARHRTFLYRYAVSRLWQKGAAEDVVQETLLAALEGGHAFRGDSALRTWLTGILKHKIADWHRREGRASGGKTDLLTEPDVDGEESLDMLFDGAGRWVKPPSDWPDPAQSLENRRFWETLDACLRSLPEAAARVFFLREIEGKSTGEICADLGISESNCWVLLHRARLRLRDELERRWFGDEERTPSKRRAGAARSKNRHDDALLLSAAGA